MHEGSSLSTLLSSEDFSLTRTDSPQLIPHYGSTCGVYLDHLKRNLDFLPHDEYVRWMEKPTITTRAAACSLLFEQFIPSDGDIEVETMGDGLPSGEEPWAEDQMTRFNM